MGDVTVAAFGVLALAGLSFLLFGAFARSRNVMVAGAALLLGLCGAWVAGLPGAAVGLVALVFLRRQRSADASRVGRAS